MPVEQRSRLGIISDTHGLLRPEALDFLRGCVRIIHAGDIGGPGILERLDELAPVSAVRGNNDTGAWCERLPESRILTVGPLTLYAIHDLSALSVEPDQLGVRLVVSGHSHKPTCLVRGGILFLNPGSAGPRRFKLPVTLAEVSVEAREVTARIVDLGADSVQKVVLTL